MEHADLLRFSIGVFERLGIEYLVTGSTASIYFGEPRFTNGIDIVARMSPQNISEFCRSFPSSDFYISIDAVRDAILTGTQFNIIAPESGLKVDVIISRDTAFDRSRFARRMKVAPDESYTASFASPEDVIVKKMEYYKEGGSEKHLRDIATILRVQGVAIDRGYVNDWASRLGLSDIWDAIVKKVG